ncbi:toprim domain-containing protein [Halomonas sp. I5-271120]|uniref:DUF7146 domain-containing protein n=1 Tax=Halomonas sp. I5-271120 TaxID=3061632 RepID=UPI0027151CC4|nr:toprim domain-containing protein [Halomonas sp. I5-271120]
MPYFKTDEVKSAVQGRWMEILDIVAPELQEAIDKAPRLVTCPVHGGKKDFRLFKDVAETGGGLCNSPACLGVHRDGFALLMAITGKSFTEVRDEIGELLDLKSYPTREERQQAQKDRQSQQAKRAQAPAPVSASAPAPSPAQGTAPAPGPQPTASDSNLSPTNRVGQEPSWKQDMPSFGAPPASQAAPAQAMAAPVSEEVPASAAVVPGVEEVEASEPAHDVHDAQESNVVPIRQDEPVSALEQMRERNPERYQAIQERKEKLERQRKREAERADGKIEEVWAGTVPLLSAGTEPAKAYFKSRGITVRWHDLLAQDCIRFHPKLEYWGEDADENPELKGKFPAIVCAIRDLKGNIRTLHRTYLTKTGKKLTRFGDARKMMSVAHETRGEVTGASIQLGEPVDGVLGVAEGLETALSAYRGTGIPCWSAVNATLLEKIEIPEGVHTVIIWADRDKSLTGQKVAESLATKLKAAGLKVITMIPEMPVPTRAKGIDWNDVLIKQGMLGFPRRVA